MKTQKAEAFLEASIGFRGISGSLRRLQGVARCVPAVSGVSEGFRDDLRCSKGFLRRFKGLGEFQGSKSRFCGVSGDH